MSKAKPIFPADSTVRQIPILGAVLSHLTYIEAHMFIMGFWFGIDAAVWVLSGRLRKARGVITEVSEYIQDVEQTKKRPDLLPGFIRNAWYMVGGFAVGFFGTLLIAGLFIKEVVSVTTLKGLLSALL